MDFSQNNAQTHKRLHTKEGSPGNSLVVQRSELGVSTAGGPGLIPGRETTIPQASHLGQKKEKNDYSKRVLQHKPLPLGPSVSLN